MSGLDLTPAPNTVWPLVADSLSWDSDGPYSSTTHTTKVTGIALDPKGQLHTYVIYNPYGARAGSIEYINRGPTHDEQLVPIEQIDIDREVLDQKLVLEWRERLTNLVGQVPSALPNLGFSALYRGLSTRD